MDVDTFFDWIRQNLINLISRELTDLNLARVQTTTWVSFKIEYEDGIIDRVRMSFKSQMMDIFRGSDLNEIVIEMSENPVLANSRSIFNEDLFTDINFHQLNLTRGGSYLPLPDRLVDKRAIINP